MTIWKPGQYPAEASSASAAARSSAAAFSAAASASLAHPSDEASLAAWASTNCLSKSSTYYIVCSLSLPELGVPSILQGLEPKGSMQQGQDGQLETHAGAQGHSASRRQQNLLPHLAQLPISFSRSFPQLLAQRIVLLLQRLQLLLRRSSTCLHKSFAVTSTSSMKDHSSRRTCQRTARLTRPGLGLNFEGQIEQAFKPTQDSHSFA